MVLLSGGGPDRAEALPAFVQQRFCDGRRARTVRLPEALCRRVGALVARWRVPRLAPALDHVGGMVPDGRLVGDLAELVGETLAEHHPQATWTVVAATHYGAPSMACAAARLSAARVQRIVVIPLVSVWVDGLSDALAGAWTAAQQAAGLGGVAVETVHGFAAHDGYAVAIHERIAEALQRFPRPLRADVHVLFALHPGTRAAPPTPEDSPLFAVVRRVAPRLAVPHHTTFAPVWGRRPLAEAGVDEEVARLVREGVRSLVVVPIGFVHETMDTAYELDVVQRAAAERLGVLQYEVAACLNLHEAFVGTLAAATCDALRFALPAGVGLAAEGTSTAETGAPSAPAIARAA